MAAPLFDEVLGTPTTMLLPLNETDEPKRSLANPLSPAEVALTIFAVLHPRHNPPVLLHGVPLGQAAH